MNLFATSIDPHLSAQALDDVRLRKMCVETVQLLSGAMRLGATRYADEEGLYAMPPSGGELVRWCAATHGNYAWAQSHAKALHEEHYWRFGSRPSSFQVMNVLRSAYFFPPGSRQPFVNRARNAKLGLDLTGEPDVCLAYRRYLNARWDRDVRPPVWTRRGAPEWRAPYDGTP